MLCVNMKLNLREQWLRDIGVITFSGLEVYTVLWISSRKWLAPRVFTSRRRESAVASASWHVCCPTTSAAADAATTTLAPLASRSSWNRTWTPETPEQRVSRATLRSRERHAAKRAVEIPAPPPALKMKIYT